MRQPQVVRWWSRVFCVLLIMLCVACQKSSVSSVPKLTFESIIPKSIQNQNILLTYRVEDAEGDLADSVFIMQHFLNKYKQNPAPVPIDLPLPQGIPLRSPMDATMKITLYFNQDILAPQDAYQNDTVYFSTYIYDKAGNKSNTVVSDTVIIYKPS